MNLEDLIIYNKNFEFNIQEESKSHKFRDGIVKELSLDNTFGERVYFSLVIPNDLGDNPCIEFIHWLDPEAENSNRTQFLSHARELAKSGILSILPDCFWSTTPEEFKKNPGLWWKTEYEFDKNLCVKQIINLLRIHDYILTLEEVDKERIALVGHDFGAMFGSLLLDFINNYKAFVLIAATTKMHHWFKFSSDISEEELSTYCKQMKIFDPINYIDLISPSPLLMQFAIDDFYVPEAVAKEFFSKAKNPKQLMWYKANHGMTNQTFIDMKRWILEEITI